MLKKIFRSEYENVTDDNGRYLHQTVREMRAVEVSCMEERWAVIGEMSKQGYHQVIPIHDIQASFIVTAILQGARLVDVALREVEKPVEGQEDEQEEKPAKSLLSRFLGVGEDSVQVQESRSRIRQEREARYQEYLVLQDKIRNELDRINEAPGQVTLFYQDLGNQHVDVVQVEKGGTVFTLESNGFISYEQTSVAMQELEDLAVNECLRYFV